jgi:nucleoside-diphosphate-sugar epimerase
MRILVLGGTGFMGKPLCESLAIQGHDVASVSRGQKPVDLPAGVTHIKGDRWKLESVADQIDAFAPEVAIDMFAMTAEDDMAVLAFFSQRVKRYVLISSCDVYRSMGRVLGTEPGPVIEGLIDEEGPLREKLYPYRDLMDHTGGSNYDKIPLERACQCDFGFDGTVLRLPMVFGPGDRQHRFRDDVKHMADDRPVLFLPGAMASWISTYGYVDNVVAAIALAATHEAGGGEIFNLGDVNDMTMEGWARAIARDMNWTGEIVVADPADLPKKRGKRAAGGNYAQAIQIDFSKIERLLGFVATVDFATAIHAMVAFERTTLDEANAEDFDYDADDAFLAKQA